MNNPLFKTYGAVVERMFAPRNGVGTPVALFPADGPLLPTDRKPPVLPIASVGEMIHPQGVQQIQGLVDHLRGALAQVRGGAGRRDDTMRRRGDDPLSSSPPLSAGEAERVQAHFTEFQAAMATGDETALTANPFYELTKLVYHHNLDGAKNLFHAVHKELMASPPKPVPLLRSFREIWLDKNPAHTVQAVQSYEVSGFSSPKKRNKLSGMLNKLSDQVDTWMGMGKVLVAIVLFFGSSFTTGQGINDLLQSEEALQLFGDLFDGRDSEVLRYGVAVLIGLLLSSAILDYKDRLFSSIAEEGGVLRGIRTAVLRYPRWMILATVLTAFSIRTNYDGIVSLISKKADLAQQSEQIKSRVKRALGSPFFVNAVEPDDLHDVQGLLENATNDSIAKFNQVPADEVSGVASSGDPRMGPRYWGKYFIVNGGYEPGVRDVAHSTQSLTAGFSGRIDEMLQTSGLDLRTSAADKIKALRKRYDDHLLQTKATVELGLDQLHGLMEMRGYSLEEIKRVFALEHYQINDLVLSMAEALEENKKEYDRVALELNQLTDGYVAVLQQVDKSGAASRREYHIEGKLTIPDLDAIKELKNTQIPKAKHKSFAELKEFLAGEYGLALANSLLFTILFISVCMDLLDPLIYSRWTALVGRQDRSLFPDLMGYMREWENNFIVGCHQFFYRRDLQQLFPGLSLPNRTGIRNAFYLLLEGLDPLVKDARDQSVVQREAQWFKGLFRLTRTRDMRHYNQRALALGRFVAERDQHFQQLLEYLLPGVRFEQGEGRDPFLVVIKKTELGQDQHREIFAWELQAVSGKLTGQDVGGGASGLSEAPEEDLVGAKVLLEQKRKSIGRLRGAGEQKRPGAEISPRAQKVDLPTPPVAVVIPSSLLKARVRPEGEVGPLLRLFFQPGSRAHHGWQQFWEAAFMAALSPFAHTRRRWLQEVARLDGSSPDDLDGLYDFMPDLKETLLVTLPAIRGDVQGALADIHRRFPTRCEQAGVPTVAEMLVRLEDLEKESLQVLGLSPAMGDHTRLYAPVGGMALELEGVSRVVLDHVGGDPTGFQEKVAGLVHYSARMLAQADGVEQKAAQEMSQIWKEVKRLHESVKQILLKINMSSTASRNTPLPLRDMLRLLRQHKETLELAPKQSEIILKTVEQIYYGKGIEEGTRHTEASLNVLKNLYAEERKLFDGLMQILVDIQGLDASAHLGEDLTEEEAEEMMRAVSLPSMDMGPSEPVMASLSRRMADSPVARPLPSEPKRVVDPGKGVEPIIGDQVVSQAIDPAEAAPLAEAEGQKGPTEAGAKRLNRGRALDQRPMPWDEPRGESFAEEPLESYGEELLIPTLVLHDDTQSPGLQMPPRPEQAEQKGVAEGKDSVRPGLEAGVADDLIVVAEFSSRQPDGTSVAPSVARAAPRLSRRPPMHWALSESEGMEPGFFSGVVPVLPAVSKAAASTAPLAIAGPNGVPESRTPPSPRPVGTPPHSPAVARGGALARSPAVSATTLEFQTKSGIHFQGLAKDVSLNGSMGNVDLKALQAQDTGRLRLVSDAGVHQFPCEVVEVSESDVTLRLFSNGHQFESVAKENIFEEVWRENQTIQRRVGGTPSSQTAAEAQLPRRWKN